jgi:DNA replication protein DnaC
MELQSQNLVVSERQSKLAAMAVEAFNEEQGDLEGYDCPACKNKGMLAVLVDGEDRYKACDCMAVRRQVRLQANSGIAEMKNKYRLDNYKTEEPWQKNVLNAAKDYLKKGGWFFIGGQVGAGKTHICTAICSEILNKGIEVKYMLWRNEATKLKANINEEFYDDMMKPLREARVLYIDDFFKGGVTQGDINLAFEVINHRYNKNLATIISSERILPELLEIDEAIGSRIKEKATYALNIENKKNWRLENEQCQLNW